MMINIPTPFRPRAAGKDAVAVNAAAVSSALDELAQIFPGLREHLFNEAAKLRAFVDVYLNSEDVRYLPDKDATAASATETLSMMSSIAEKC
jgi:hypothetical protein